MGTSPWNATRVILERGFSASGLLTVWLDSSLLWELSCDSQRCLQSLPSIPCEGKIALLSRLYLFPVAIVTNCHRFSALKQQISFLMVLEVRNSKAGLCSVWRLQGKSVSLPFPASTGLPPGITSPLVPSPVFQASCVASSNLSL